MVVLVVLMVFEVEVVLIVAEVVLAAFVLVLLAAFNFASPQSTLSAKEISLKDPQARCQSQSQWLRVD